MRFLPSLLVLLLCTCVRAQVIGYVDSVEVHRTDTIYFAFGSAELDGTAHDKVHAVATDRPGDLELYLEGHTDAVGSNRANDDLARRRSLNTRAVVSAAGWPAERIELRHFGERDLAVNTRAREVRNRRVLLRSGLPKRYARLRGRVTDKDDRPLSGVVISHGTFLRDTVTTRSDGTYDVYVPLRDSVRIDVYAPGHFFRSHQLNLGDTAAVTDFHTRLAPAGKGARMTVPDMFFVGNKPILLKRSEPTLPRLLQFLRMTPDVRVELAGHVNNPAPPQEPGTWSYRLSFDRAKMVYDYLLHHGIAKERLRFRGYSNHEQVFPKAKGEREMRMNRRVEIRVW